ncbi:MAG: flagellar export protein FliJ [Pseudomonadota bacterium]
MTFHFKLEPVLTVRKNLEEQIQLKLAREQMILSNHQLRIKDLQAKRIELCKAMEEKIKHTMQARNFLFHMDSIRVLELQVHILINTIAAQKQIVARVQTELAEAMKQRKIIDVLRENALQKYLGEARRKEQNESDEQALLRYGRGIVL